MSRCDEKSCIWCEHFTIKLMLNGYNGICEKQGIFTRFEEHCEEWEKREMSEDPKRDE